MKEPTSVSPKPHLQRMLPCFNLTCFWYQVLFSMLFSTAESTNAGGILSWSSWRRLMKLLHHLQRDTNRGTMEDMEETVFLILNIWLFVIIYLLYFFKDFSIRIFLQVHWVHVMWPGCLTHFRTVRQRRADTVDAGWTVTGSLLHSRADINTNTDNIHRWTIVHVEQQQQLWSPYNAN